MNYYSPLRLKFMLILININIIVIILHNLFLVDKVLNAYYVKLLAPPTIIHPLYSKKNKNGTVH